MAKVPENFMMQRRMNGMDVYLPASDIAVGDVADSTNLYSYDGEWYSRWGKQACFVTPPSSSPNYAVTEFMRSDGSSVIVFCNGGKLYFTVVGTPPMTWTEIKIGGSTSFSLNSPNVQMKKSGKYLYVVDGMGPLYRVNVNADNSYGATAVTALSLPNAPTAALTNSILDAASDATKWSSFPALSWPNNMSVSNPETVNNTANQQFSGGTGSPSPHPTGWLTGGDSMGFQASATGAGSECYFDVGNGPEWVDWDYPTPTYPTSGGPAGGVQNTIASARVWIGNALGHSSGGGAFQMIAFPENATETTYSDLAIGSGGNTLTSSANPFSSGDVDKVITIFGGSSGTWTLGNYTITSVSGSTATVNGTVGTNGSTGGVGTKNLDAGGAAGNNNYTLQNPASAITGASQVSPLFKCSASNAKFSNVFSWSGLGEDFDYVKYRLQGPAQNVGTGVNTPSLQVVDVRLIATNLNGRVHLRANDPIGGGVGANCLGGVWVKRDYTGSTTTYSDLVIASYSSTTNTSTVTSAGHPFSSANVGQVLTVTSTTGGWSAGNYPIVSVSGTTATVSGDLGTVGSTSGAGTAYGVKDFSKSNVINIGYSAPSTTPQIPFRVGILKAGQPISTSGVSNIIWSNLVSYSTNNDSFYVDISTIDVTDSNARAQCAYLFIKIETDLPTTINPADLCTIGPITAAGNLSIGLADYFYVGVEAQDNSLTTAGASTGDSTDGVLLSNPSGPSTPNLTATNYQAQSIVNFGSSWANNTANWLCVYRFGGALAGPNVTTYTSYVLLDQCPRWLGTSNGQQTPQALGGVGGGLWTWNASTRLWSSSDGYRTWNPSTRMLTDNTPDLALIGNDFLNAGRGGPPVGATCVEMWNNRLVLALGSTLYISDLMSTDTAAALYYASTVDPEDPYAVTKGGIYPVEANDNDSIVQLKTHGQYLDIFKQKSVHLLTGQDPVSGFQLTPHLKDAGIGLVGGPQAVCAFDLNVAFVGPSAVHEYKAEPVHFSFGILQAYEDAEQAPIISQKIEPLIAPYLKGGTPIAPSAYRNMVLNYHGRRLWLFAPAPSGSTNSVAYVFDTRPATDGSGPVGWTRLTNFNIVSCCSLSSQSDSEALYMGGADGQLYVLAGNADVSYVSAATNASPIVVTTSGAHGLSNGQPVVVSGVGGNTAANTTGQNYWYAGPLTSTTFSLYQDPALTRPVVGNGSYTSVGTASASIVWNVTSRGFMNETNDFRYFKANRPTRAYFLVSTGEQAQVGFAVSVVGGTGGSGEPANFSTTYPINGQFADVRFKVPAEIRGYGAVQVGVSGSTSTQSRVTAFGVEDAKGAIRGNV